MLRPIENNDPSFVRRELQTRSDSYMSGDRLRLGVVLPGVTLSEMGSNQTERDHAYDKLAERWPNKSKGLITKVARELLFEESSMNSHIHHVSGIAEGISGRVTDLRFGFLSGLGRNACMYSIVDTRQGNPMILPIIMRGAAEYDLVDKQFPTDGLILDPDFELGGINGPTPEAFGIEGSEELANKVAGYFGRAIQEVSA